MNPLIHAAVFLIQFILDAFIVLFSLRFILQKVGANWHNPVSQVVITLTKHPHLLVRKFIPGVRGFDLSLLVLAIVLQIIEIIVINYLEMEVMTPLMTLLLLTLAQLLSKTLMIYIYALIINAVLSWLPQLQLHPIAHITGLIVEPILCKIRRFLPNISGIDLSPLLALLVLMMMNILIVNPLLEYAIRSMAVLPI